MWRQVSQLHRARNVRFSIAMTPYLGSHTLQLSLESCPVRILLFHRLSAPLRAGGCCGRRREQRSIHRLLYASGACKSPPSGIRGWDLTVQCCES